jgi:hypothetical protein
LAALGVFAINATAHASSVTIDANTAEFDLSVADGMVDGVGTYGKNSTDFAFDVQPGDFVTQGGDISNVAVIDAFAHLWSDPSFGDDEVWKSGGASYQWSGNGSSGGTLSYTGNGDDVLDCKTQNCYLVVKDGNHNPYAYLIDLSVLVAGGWNGWDDLILSNFWGNQCQAKGAISHVALHGSLYDEPPIDFPRISQVPLPASAWLFLSALGGLTALRKRRTANA